MTTPGGDEELAKSNRDSRRPITIAAIIAATVIILACIVACAGTAIVLIYNLPF
jgi:hypothetical protein